MVTIAETGPSEEDQEEIYEQAMGDILDDDLGEGEYCPPRSPRFDAEGEMHAVGSNGEPDHGAQRVIVTGAL